LNEEMNVIRLIEDERDDDLIHQISSVSMEADVVDVPTFVPHAAAVVREILQQITANDAPAGNENMNQVKISQNPSKVAAWPSSENVESSNLNRREIHGTTSLDTDLTEAYTAANQSSPDIRNKEMECSETSTQLPVTKMGNTGLAALCMSTLQVVDPSSCTPLHEKPPQFETPLVGTNQTSHICHVAKMHSPLSRRYSSKRNKKFALGRHKGSDDIRTVYEEKKEEGSIMHHRLQLFGSEYARHLSSCQLAPIIANKTLKPLRRKQYNRNRFTPLEHAKSDVQTGALLDIVVTCNDEPTPASYYRVSQTGSGRSAAFGGLHNMYLNVKKESVWDKAAQRPCVTALTFIFPDRQEFVPPGFCVVRLASDGRPANLNQSSQNSERVYLCLRRSREGNPITGLVPLVPSFGEAIPLGYTVIEHTPRNLTAHFSGVTGESIFLAYRQRLANLESLRPPPLVDTLVQAVKDPCRRQDQLKLSSYYATGGAIVESDIGKFHILDRSTHSLLSPSSIANRLNLIEMSRRRGSDENGIVTTAPLTYARSDCGESDVGSNGSYASVDLELRQAIRSKAGGSLADLPIYEQDNGHETNDYASECSTTLKEDHDDEENAANLSSLLSSAALEVRSDSRPCEEDVERRLCIEAMSFIPEIESMHKNEKDCAQLKLRTELLTPILTACYTRHGGAALLAVGGLVTLLSKTDFFRDDINPFLEFPSGIDTRITLLDLSIQVVSDVATSGSHEATFASCLDFVEHAVSFSQGQLNMRTVGYVFRLYLFIFYFDASIPRKSSEKCPSLSWRPIAMHKEEDFPMLYDPRSDSIIRDGYLTGGAPQAAVLALKELVSLSIERLGKISVAGCLLMDQKPIDKQVPNDTESRQTDIYAPLIDCVLSSLVDKSVDLVERANFTQLALHQIHRSGGSELFWHDMIYACGSGLFAKDRNLTEAGKEMFILLFAMLQQLVKVSSGKLRPSIEDTDLLPKDVASKLLSLELLLHFLEFWSDEQEAIRSMPNVNERNALESINILMFAVRRTVTPCLLWNTRAGLENPQVFRRVIRIISELWCSPFYRKHCKVELGILIEHFGLKILELGPQCLLKSSDERGIHSLLSQQIELIGEIKNWLSSDPKDVIEMYLNYDTDITEETTGQLHFLPGTSWQIFQRMCAGLSGIAERCGELIGNQILQNQSIILSLADKYNVAKSHLLSSRDEAKRDATDKAEMREAARVLRKASLEAIAQIVKNLAISAGAGAGNQLMNLMLSWSPPDFPISYENMPLHSAPTNARQQDDNKSKPNRPSASTIEGGDGVVKFWRTVIGKDQARRYAGSIPSTSESLETAFGIIKQKSLKKAVEYLIACNILTPAPRDVANFLRIHKDRIDPAALGQYLGENGTGGAESEYWNSIRYLFVRAISFIGMNVDKGYDYISHGIAGYLFQMDHLTTVPILLDLDTF
jgi:Guanine nucleotide exchange factor in Golgi transport N-terminal/Sec7 domain